jgi:hypothetical protein
LIDFDAVEKHMKSVNWCWGINVKNPTLNELKETSYKLLLSVSKLDLGDWSETGGFMAVNCGDYLKLMFSVDSVDSIVLNLTDTYDRDKLIKERKNKIEKIDEISTKKEK